MVAAIGLGQPLDDLADGVQRVAVGKVAVRGGDVGLDGVGERIHTGVGAQLGGHGVGELGVDDGDIGGDVEVGQRVLDALLVVGDDGERGDLGGGAGGGGDGAEAGLLTQLREAERHDGLLEGLLRILIEQPHGLGGIDGRATADGDDPIGAELGHGLGATLDGLHGRIGLDALEDLDLEAGLFQIGLDILQKAATAHGAAAGHDHGAGALEVLHLVASALTEEQVARIGKTSHTDTSRSRALLPAVAQGHPMAPQGPCHAPDEAHRRPPRASAPAAFAGARTRRKRASASFYPAWAPLQPPSRRAAPTAR